MIIRRYKTEDQENLINLIKSEGEEWNCYTAKEVVNKYKKSLEKSITYVALKDDVLCGYSRSLDDHGFYIYICDLLVAKEFRNQRIGQKLLEQLCLDYPEQTVYVMSDEDDYYMKKGYSREGSVFEVKSDLVIDTKEKE